MPDNKTKINSVVIDNWNSYLKFHSADGGYRTLQAKNLGMEFQKLVKSNEMRMAYIHEAFEAIAPHFIATEGPTFRRIIDLPEYRAIAYNEIMQWIVYWGEDGARWKDPKTDEMNDKIGNELVKAGQFVYENFFEETFYQYAVTKAISSGQSLKDRERLLKRQVDHNQRVGKKAPWQNIIQSGE